MVSIISFFALTLWLSGEKFQYREFNGINKKVNQVRQKTQDLSMYLLDTINTGGRYSLNKKIKNSKILKEKLNLKINNLLLKIKNINTFNINGKIKTSAKLYRIQKALQTIDQALNLAQKITDENSIISVKSRLNFSLFITTSLK